MFVCLFDALFLPDGIGPPKLLIKDTVRSSGKEHAVGHADECGPPGAQSPRMLAQASRVYFAMNVAPLGWTLKWEPLDEVFFGLSQFEMHSQSGERGLICQSTTESRCKKKKKNAEL